MSMCLKCSLCLLLSSIDIQLTFSSRIKISNSFERAEIELETFSKQNYSLIFEGSVSIPAPVELSEKPLLALVFTRHHNSATETHSSLEISGWLFSASVSITNVLETVYHLLVECDSQKCHNLAIP